MIIPTLSASEIYEIVKGHGDMYDHTLYMAGRLGWRQTGTNWRIPDPIAYLTLLALYLLEAECGVLDMTDIHVARPGKPWQAVPALNSSRPCDYGADPLSAAVAAYERKKGAERG